jgi:histidyl-tRNA synthetase
VSAFQAPTGTRDVLPPESARFQEVVSRFAVLAARYDFGLLVSPMFEDAALFRRGAGESSELVQKEMYEFEDKGGRLLALRPEGTASVVRAFVQHNPNTPWKVWYATPAFRYERPQAGRYRQHHQLGVEVIGSEDPDLDVEVISLGSDFLSAVGIARVDLRVNTMGDGNCLPGYQSKLSAFLSENEAALCSEHSEHWRDNPLRVFDCKTPQCLALRQRAPLLSEALCEPCRAHFARVVEGLDAAGIGWRRDEFLVRGLDYYTRTTFEFSAPMLEAAQNTVLGGGRYDKLSAELGGPDVGGIGFGSGVERVLLACEAEGALADVELAPQVFVVDLLDGTEGRDLVRLLRAGGLSAERAYDMRSAKAQLRLADRSGARLGVIVGRDEMAAGTVTVRVLRGEGAGHQESVERPALEGLLRKWLG